MSMGYTLETGAVPEFDILAWPRVKAGQLLHVTSRSPLNFSCHAHVGKVSGTHVICNQLREHATEYIKHAP